MAGDAESVAGEATETVAGKATEVQKIPDDLKPVFDAYANRAAESAAKRAEEKVRKEFEELERLSKMSEADRQKAETEALTRELEILRGERKYLTTQTRVKDAVARNGFVPPEIVDAVLREAIDSGNDVDAEAVARTASERFQGYLSATGKVAHRQPTQATRGGTPAGRADPNDFASMTQEQILDHSKTLGGMKGAKYLSDSQNFLLRGGKFAGS